MALLVSLAAASAAAAQVPPEEPRIRAAVTVAGVDVGGLTLAEAETKLALELGPLFARDVTVVAAKRTFTLPMARIGFRLRADSTAQRAYDAGLAAPANPDGTLPPASAEPSVAYRRDPVWRFARNVAEKVERAPRDARVKIKLRKIRRFAGRPGRELDVRPLVAAIQATVEDPAAVRELRPRLRHPLPDVRTRELKRVYRTIITIDRSSFTLRLFKKLRVAKRYRVAVGLPDYPTPAGLFSIQSKQINPVWTAPNSPWAGEMAGQSVPGGAWNNPLKARWMGVTGAVGIHGTGMPWSIGTRASHGCIRMTVPDVIDLFRRVPLGTPVLIR